ncbi:MAG: hypothetical protein KGJ60_02165 [Verrucomicrobiota bacterium]|nr:hypothetical protein [Verrucomicrobiota bacterium]
MKNHLPVIATGLCLLAGLAASAETKVTVDYHNNDTTTPEFAFESVSSPSADDAATTARFAIVYGDADPHSGGLDKLHDGRLPDEPDQPGENFFFQAGTDGGRLLVDLGRVISIREVNTYSWHPGARGPQIYKLYASDGTAENFNTRPAKRISPVECGWKFIATVNTQPKSGTGGGQYGVTISDSDGSLGHYRYLLFDIAPTELEDNFGNTFYSEMDVVDADAPAAPRPISTAVFSVKAADGRSTITINADRAPALKDWAEHKLAPVVAGWYPKIAAMLPSPGYTPPARVRILIKPMNGVAYTSGDTIAVSSAWIQAQMGRQALGSVVHELVHVVQQFGHHAGHNPGWLVEGTADYIRWFKYEPQSHGADLVWMRRLRHFTPRYNDSYRVTANFLNWVAEKYDPDIVRQLNAAMREGKYEDNLWKRHTGKTAPELGAEWKNDIEAQFARMDTSTTRD